MNAIMLLYSRSTYAYADADVYRPISDVNKERASCDFPSDRPWITISFGLRRLHAKRTFELISCESVTIEKRTKPGYPNYTGQGFFFNL